MILTYIFIESKLVNMKDRNLNREKKVAGEFNEEIVCLGK